ncbi:MAG: hypothetical protein NZ522_01385 [Chitinophagales bacterium]|nr:hypothetical protein [Chitinophagales bacterium]
MRYLFWLIMFFFSCQSAPNKNAVEENNYDMFVYQIKYGEQLYESVTGIALLKRKVYYLANDSSLMTYKKLPANATEIQNDDLKKLLTKIDFKEFAKIKDYSKCNCKVITKTEYIVRYIKNKKEQNFVFNEVLNCDVKSPCYFLEKISKYFTDLQK